MKKYHYTYGHKIESIIMTGLKCSPKGTSRKNKDGKWYNHIGAREKPIIWFSSNPQFEMTARKPRYKFDEYRNLTTTDVSLVDDVKEIGLFRFVVPSYLNETIKPWILLRPEAGIALIDFNRINKAGKALGGNPIEWFGLVMEEEWSLCVHDFKLQYLDENMKWHDCSQEEGIAIAKSKPMANVNSLNLGSLV